MGERLRDSEQRPPPVGGLDRGDERLLGPARRGPVRRQLRRVWPLRSHESASASRACSSSRSPGRTRAVHGFGQQGVAEAERARRRLGDEHAGLDRLPQRGLHLPIGNAGGRLQQRDSHVAAGHRRQPQQLLRALIERGDTLEQHVSELPWELVAPPLHGRRGELFGEERVPFRARRDAGGQLRRGGATEAGGDQLVQLVCARAGRARRRGPILSGARRR